MYRVSCHIAFLCLLDGCDPENVDTLIAMCTDGEDTDYRMHAFL